MGAGGDAKKPDYSFKISFTNSGNLAIRYKGTDNILRLVRNQRLNPDPIGTVTKIELETEAFSLWF